MMWYYLSDTREVIGPVSEQDLIELNTAGTLTTASQVCREGTEEWITLAELLGSYTSVSAVEEANVSEVSELGQEPTSLAALGETPPPQDNIAASAPQVETTEHEESAESLTDSLQAEAKAGWSEVKRHSKQAALKAQIETLRNVDLRKAYHALGKQCFESAALESELTEQFQAIREIDAKIADKRETPGGEADESKIAALKRMGKDAVQASHAQALTLKRQNLLTQLGQSAFSLKGNEDITGLEAEIEAVDSVEAQIQLMESEIEDFKANTLAHGPPEDFPLRSAIPLFVCCLGFGWLVTIILPERYFIGGGIIGNWLPVILLAVPALVLTLLGIFSFLKPPTVKWPVVLGGLFFTMIFGLMILLAFHSLADASQGIANRSYGRANAFVYGVKAIGWAGQNMDSANLFQRLISSIIHTGLCEEVTKLLPVFLVALLYRKKSDLPPLKGFLLLGFFSGIGFGIGEALYGYSPSAGNIGLGSNVTRWFACVPLHGVYATVDSALLWLLVPSLKKAKGPGEAVGILVVAALAIAIIHGVYNTIAASNLLLAIFCDAAAIIFMVVLVRYCAKRESNDTDHHTSFTLPASFPSWLTRGSTRSPHLLRIYGGAAVMVFSSMVFSTGAAKARAKLESSYSYPGASPQRPSGNFIARNREAVSQFNVNYSIAQRVSPGSIESFLAAVDQTNWSGVGPDLAEAVMGVRSIKNGDLRDDVMRRIDRFNAVCRLYQ